MVAATLMNFTPNICNAQQPSSFYVIAGYHYLFSRELKISPDVNGSNSNPSFDDELGHNDFYAGGIGYQIVPGLRLGFMLEYSDQGVDGLRSKEVLHSDKTYSFDFVTRAILFTLTADGSLLGDDFVYWFDHEKYITPFVTAGWGYAWNYVDDFRSTNLNGETEFEPSNDFYTAIYAIGAGLRYKANERVSLNFGYHYLYAGDLTSSNDLLGNAELGNASVLNASITIQELFFNIEVFL